ncbi:NADPH:quinone reductase-like Zn-dependent oxidoreductase [Mumia flava]|uniref:NADPH:quinone reductase-like Zn-dependent oxidoreductase n=1 Tax=Mumia flava TaxID=1348852 RepID=A0A0B2B714_9ACTN|nr:NAD(P)-dependent alcohol dehydrogenase [Mumia flava]PJJ57883.1 NADPH:quinone reductase-like Zn-dependent oxidoreductase [Mumia flava]
MRAAVRDGYGGPEVVRVVDVPDPVPGPREVLVRVRATTVNRTDAAYRAGLPRPARAVYGWPRPKAKVLGCELAGDVVGVGEEVSVFAVGDRVYGYVEGRFGAHAELVAVPEDGWLEPVPDGLTHADAVAATEGPHYALAFLVRTHVRPGQSVLVIGATGAIGSACVQLAAHRGARVTALCDAEHADVVARLGAGEVVDRARGLDALTGPYDVVLDAVGKASFASCRRLLRPGGAYSSSEPGRGGVNFALAAIGPLVRRRRHVVFPLPSEDAATRRTLHAALAAGDLVPLIDPHRFGLEEIVEAYRYVDTGTKLGSVVVDVP